MSYYAVPPTNQGMTPFALWFNETFRLWSQNTQVWILQGLIYFAIAVVPNIAMVFLADFLSGMSSRSSGPDVYSITYTMTFLLFNIIAATVLIPGFIITALKQMRGQQIAVSDLFSGARHFGSIILIGIATTLGYLLCCIGGFFTTGLFFLAAPLVVDKEMRPIEALSTSWDTTKSNLWLYCLFAVVMAILSSLGTSFCYIGAILTIPWLFIGQAVAYERTMNWNNANYMNMAQPTGYSAVPPPYMPPPSAAPTAGDEIPTCRWCGGALNKDSATCPRCGQPQ